MTKRPACTARLNDRRSAASSRLISAGFVIFVVETKGYRREDAKDKKLTMDTYWCLA